MKTKQTNSPNKNSLKIKDRIIKEWQNGNVCFLTVDGIMMQPMEWFTSQPLDGMLYDMNRDEATVLSFLDDRKWINDYALTKMLRHYYNRCIELEKEIKELKK